MMWRDKRGNWHIIAHTYVEQPFPNNSISGHAYSTNLVNWTFSSIEPYLEPMESMEPYPLQSPEASSLPQGPREFH